jgi:hypothetical protein
VTLFWFVRDVLSVRLEAIGDLLDRVKKLVSWTRPLKSTKRCFAGAYAD